MAFAQFNQSISGSRKPAAAGVYVNGIWHPAPLEPITLHTSVQPTKPSDLELLPEGRRIDRSYTFYSREVVVEGDVLTVAGLPYEVLHVEVWQNRVIPHYKAIAVKMNEMEAD